MTMRPVRLQLSRKKGFNLQKLSRETNGLEAANVARPSKWGNPFMAIGGVTKATCVEQFRVRMSGNNQAAERGEIAKHLRDKNLACWCKPGEPCHADVLLEFANK